MEAGSLIVTLDPAGGGGVYTMQRAVFAAHVRLGLKPRIAFARQDPGDRLGRWSPAVRHRVVGDQQTVSSGYYPTVEYLNYVYPALALRREVARAPVVQVVSGMHSASLLPIFARRPFVSWIATPFTDELSSRWAGQSPSLSVRLNHALGFVNKGLERITCRFPGVLFALSLYTAARIADAAGLPRERVEVLRCPVDLGRFSPEGARAPGMPGRYLLSVGRVDDDRKNFASLVRAFAPVAAAIPDLHLVIAGPVDRATSPVARLSESLGLGARVHFPGSFGAGDLAPIYRGADGYVMTSRQEGLGIVVIEAQASALPVIIMRCGGSDELVNDGQDGWLVDQGDEATFTRRLLEILPHPETRARVGAAARRKIQDELSEEAFAARLAEAYARVYGRAAPPTA